MSRAPQQPDLVREIKRIKEEIVALRIRRPSSDIGNIEWVDVTSNFDDQGWGVWTNDAIFMGTIFGIVFLRGTIYAQASGTRGTFAEDLPAQFEPAGSETPEMTFVTSSESQVPGSPGDTSLVGWVGDMIVAPQGGGVELQLQHRVVHIDGSTQHFGLSQGTVIMLCGMCYPL